MGLSDCLLLLREAPAGCGCGVLPLDKWLGEIPRTSKRIEAEDEHRQVILPLVERAAELHVISQNTGMMERLDKALGKLSMPLRTKANGALRHAMSKQIQRLHDPRARSMHQKRCNMCTGGRSGRSRSRTWRPARRTGRSTRARSSAEPSCCRPRRMRGSGRCGCDDRQSGDHPREQLRHQRPALSFPPY